MDKPESICTCKQCKKNFPAPNKRFSVCGPECQAILDAAYVRPPRPTVTLTCQYCAKTVTRKAQRYEYGKYCSRPCAYAGRAITRAAAAAEAKALRDAQKAKEDRTKLMAWVAKERAKQIEQAAKPNFKDCVICVGTYDHKTRPFNAPVCCAPCYEDYKIRKKASNRNAPGRRAEKAASKAKRRMLEADTRVDNIDPLRVFERDQWRCYMCGVTTPMALRGTNEPTAPELEHVVSLADGGTHTWNNLACACRTCNGLKGSISYFDYQVNINGPQTTRLNP